MEYARLLYRQHSLQQRRTYPDNYQALTSGSTSVQFLAASFLGWHELLLQNNESHSSCRTEKARQVIMAESPYVAWLHLWCNTFNGKPLKSGHLHNQDTWIWSGGILIMEAPLYSLLTSSPEIHMDSSLVSPPSEGLRLMKVVIGYG